MNRRPGRTLAQLHRGGVAPPGKPTDANVVKLSLAHARGSGRRFSTFTDEMFWPEMEVRLYLKGASRVVSMTTTDDAVLERAAHETIYSLT